MIVGLVSQDVLEGEEAVRAGVFNTVSMMTTTGFANADFALWTSLTSLVLFGVTLLGASAGSTSGSIKLIRHVVIGKMLRREIDQTLHPGVVVPLRVNGRSSTSARCARSSCSSSSTSACGPRARSRSCSTRHCRASS